MKSGAIERIGVVLLTLVLCTIFATSCHGSEKSMRGDYPQCQDECVSQLNKRMADLSDAYKKQENKLLYEEQVERTRADYDDCIDRCKAVRPVK